MTALQNDTLELPLDACAFFILVLFGDNNNFYAFLDNRLPLNDASGVKTVK